MKQTTLHRHELIRKRLDQEVKLLSDSTNKSVQEACNKLANETGFSPRTLRDIYYKCT